MRIFITGATGFAGGWLAQELAISRPDAALFGMAHSAGEKPEWLPPMTIRQADLANPETVRALIDEAQPDVVFHLAGFASGAGTDAEKIRKINVDGTVALLQLLSERDKPCRVLLASSGYVYGATEPDRPAREDDPPKATGAYAESKAAMEEAVRPFASDSLPLTIVRSFNHTGPRQTPDFVVPAFARQIAQIEKGAGEPVVRHGNLDAVRDFLAVRDVVRAYRQLMLETEPEPWRVVNVCCGTGVVMRELLERLIALSSVTVTHEQDPARLRPSDLPVCVGDPSTLKALTGWEPTVSLETTLADTLDYWRQVGA